MAASRNSLRSSLPARVAAFLATRTAPGERICAGLSGGCDSVVLLHVLAALRPREQLRALHVHHGLSANADGWAAFCTDYCRLLGIDLLVERVDVDRHTGLGLEAAAREARYRAFSRSAGELLLLGHHQGDQAETLLFNLVRGAGVAGAAGIPVERHGQCLRILRPLLDVSRDEIETYARDHRLDWVDDESNRDTGLSRNFLRHQVLTVLAARFPAAEMNLAQAAGRFAEADDLLRELAVIDWQAAAEGDALKLAKLRELSLPRLKNLLRFRLRQLGWHAPGAARLEEFSRQVLTAGADRHPALDLAEGSMVAGRGVLRWVARG
jgi:tRNA(Ile)-lysidine synthase